MVGTTLAEIRQHVESLASPDGPYVVHCGRTGERPIPTAGNRFESRTLAERAASAAGQYRAALRRYDPRLPHYDLVVSRDVEPRGSDGRESSDSDRDRHPGPGVGTELEERSQHSPLVEFCHRVAAAVFETLCDSGHRDVETAVMDVYFELAETVDDPDTLCLCLLESMAVELDQRLTPVEQAALFTEAATRLSPTESVGDPVSTALATLEERGLLSGYSCSPSLVDLDDGTRAVDVRLTNYALSPRNGRLPVFPLVLGVYRHESEWPLSSLRAVAVADGWELTLVHSRDSDPTDLASVPIEPEA
ncbi:DUF7551 domain-containing protein [Halogeometricum limi]|uniref:Uncharacterized protein n=1 Tax=Halogeometricum limi TaxID=555875 RepID=A0A1I6IF68_9EURY|nr:hypothetical protein [Halogeometricum limi]SFR65279.1 hypothetical protein SAMN04488124_3167 [Halogeometricum limi]